MTNQEIKQAWKNRKLIIQGVWNTIFRSKYVENIANERKAICEACPFIDREGSKCFMPGTQPCCGKCGCSLKFKLNSLSSDCGDKENPRWKAVMTEEQEESYRKKNGTS
jgi:hypothetical protein